jgi:hypothetical protein
LPANKTLTIFAGGYESQFTLNNSGQANNKTDSIKLSWPTYKTVRGKGYVIQPVKFAYTVKKQNLFSYLQACGFSNAKVSGVNITLPVLIDLDGAGYLATPKLKYSATAGKSGTAK